MQRSSGFFRGQDPGSHRHAHVIASEKKGPGRDRGKGIQERDFFQDGMNERRVGSPDPLKQTMVE